MEPKTVIYQEKSTGRWVAEIIDLDALTVGKHLWRGVYGSKEEAQRAAQKGLDKRMRDTQKP